MQPGELAERALMMIIDGSRKPQHRCVIRGCVPKKLMVYGYEQCVRDHQHR